MGLIQDIKECRCGHKDLEHTDYNEIYHGDTFSLTSESLYCDICKSTCINKDNVN